MLHELSEGKSTLTAIGSTSDDTKIHAFSPFIKSPALFEDNLLRADIPNFLRRDAVNFTMNKPPNEKSKTDCFVCILVYL